MMPYEAATKDGQEVRSPMGTLYAGALDEARTMLRKHLALVAKLIAAGRIEEAEVTLTKTERQAAGVFSCLKKGTKKDRAYKEMLEDELDDLRRSLALAARKSRPRCLSKRQGLLLLVGVAVVIVLAAMAVVP